MKKLLLGGLAVLAVFVGSAFASDPVTWKEKEFDGQAVSTAAIFDLNEFDRVSVQAIYADGTPSAKSFAEGNKSTATITVSNYNFASATPSVTITIDGGSTLDDQYVTLNGIKYTEGVNFSVGASSGATAENLRAAIDANPHFYATRASGVITVYPQSGAGTAGNGWSVTTSSAGELTVNSSSFTGGAYQHYISINGTRLTEGVDFTAETSSQATAINIMNAIKANATLSAIIDASTGSPTGVVYATSTLPGVNAYRLISSTSGITFSGTYFENGTASDVDFTNDQITETSHGFQTGLPVYFSSASGNGLSPLVNDTTYYAIRVDADHYKLAELSTSAVAGVAVDLTTATTDGVGGTMTVTPMNGTTLSGAAGFYWTVSNDGANFASYQTSMSSVTYSASGNTIYNVGEFNHRYLKLNLDAPATSGALDLAIWIRGIKED